MDAGELIRIVIMVAILALAIWGSFWIIAQMSRFQDGAKVVVGVIWLIVIIAIVLYHSGVTSTGGGKRLFSAFFTQII